MKKAVIVLAVILVLILLGPIEIIPMLGSTLSNSPVYLFTIISINGYALL